MNSHAVATLDLTQVRVLLRAIVSGSKPPSQLPAQLFALAACALPPRQRNHDAVQDLVGDLLLHLAEVTHAGDLRSATHLLELDDAQLKAALRQRLRQLAAEGCRRWALVKVMRAHVRAAFAEALPAVEALPLSLLGGGRLSRARVAEAVAHLQDVHPELRGDAVALTNELLACYFPDDLRLEPEGWQRLAANDNGPSVEDQIDAAVVETWTRDLLGVEATAVLALRSQGLSLETIGRCCGKATSTVFCHLREALERLKVGLGDEATPESFRLALGSMGGGIQ